MIERKLILTEDGSHTIFVPELHETYHSTHGAIQESTHVFIRHGLQYFLSIKNQREARIFEVGFGTGLNALLTAQFAIENECSVQYESIEAYPLENKEIENLNYTDKLKAGQIRDIFVSLHRCPWEKWQEISICFKLRKVNQKLQDYIFKELFDVCYFDAFAPSKQPEMWTIDILRKIYDGLNINGIFVTYCAKGQLKRDLREIGFQVETLSGPPGKKEMVRAIKM